tara:strand:+ start:97 stop:585 length:489 start_codon:yes stop_codon:yes gene_type:complete
MGYLKPTSEDSCDVFAIIHLVDEHIRNTENKYLNVYLLFVTIMTVLTATHLELLEEGDVIFPLSICIVYMLVSLVFLTQLDKYSAWKKHYQRNIRTLMKNAYGEDYYARANGGLPGWFEENYRRPGFLSNLSSDTFFQMAPWLVLVASGIRAAFVLFAGAEV